MPALYGYSSLALEAGSAVEVGLLLAAFDSAPLGCTRTAQRTGILSAQVTTARERGLHSNRNPQLNACATLLPATGGGLSDPLVTAEPLGAQKHSDARDPLDLP